MLIRHAGQTLFRERCPTPSTYEAALQAVKELVDRGRAEIPFPAHTGIGLATPGVQCEDGTLMNCNSTMLNRKSFQKDLENLLECPTRLMNDANCLVLSEVRFGCAQGEQGLVLGLILGTGMGGGLVFNLKVWPGLQGLAGEVGHTPVPAVGWWTGFNGRPCYCGRQDCAETWLSGPGLAHTYYRKTGHQQTAEWVCAHLEEAEARQVMDDYLAKLGALMGNLVNVLDPSLIILGGGLSNCRYLLDNLGGAMRAHVFSNRPIQTRVLAAEMGDSSGVFGASVLFD